MKLWGILKPKFRIFVLYWKMWAVRDAVVTIRRASFLSSIALPVLADRSTSEAYMLAVDTLVQCNKETELALKVLRKAGL